MPNKIKMRQVQAQLLEIVRNDKDKKKSHLFIRWLYFPKLFFKLMSPGRAKKAAIFLSFYPF